MGADSLQQTLVYSSIHSFRCSHVRSIDQFSLDQHVMTDTETLTKQGIQEQVVNELQRSIAGPGQVLMLLQ